MSIDQTPTLAHVEPLTLKQLGELLVRHYKIKTGKYEVLVEFQFGAGAVGLQPEQKIPGLVIGVNRIGLTPTTTDGPNTIDASKIRKGRKPSS